MQATYEAIIQGTPEKALEIFRSKYRAFVTNHKELYSFARLLQELGHGEELRSVCILLLQHPEYCTYAAYQIGIHLVEQGASPTAAAGEVCVQEAEKYQDVITKLLHERPLRPSLHARHIAICGTAYCGSTLLDRLLNGLDGVGSIGESRWLAVSYRARQAGVYDFHDPLGPATVQCSACGKACPVLTPDFRTNLAVDPTDWYFKIANRLDVKVLITADKNLQKFVLNDPRLRLDALVLFKSPTQAWASVYSKQPANLSAGELEDKMKDFMAKWQTTYSQMLSQFKPQGRKIFVNFDEFTVSPGPYLRHITAQLSLSFQPRVLERSVPGHSIGGNQGTMSRLRASDYAVKVEPLGEPKIPREHAVWIDHQSGLTELFDAMNALAGPMALSATG